MTSRDCLDRPAPSLALPGLLVLLAALLAGLLACAGDPPASCGAIGRVSSCPCPGGAQGAQECGPAGVWSACACPGADAGAEVGADAVAVVDAGPEASADDAPPALDADAVAVVDAPDAASDAGADAPRDATGELADAHEDLVPSDCVTVPDDAPPAIQAGDGTRLLIRVHGSSFEWTAQDSAECTATLTDGGPPAIGFRATYCADPRACTLVSGNNGALYIRDEFGTVMYTATPMYSFRGRYTFDGRTYVGFTAYAVLSCGRIVRVAVSGCPVTSP